MKTTLEAMSIGRGMEYGSAVSVAFPHSSELIPGLKRLKYAFPVLQGPFSLFF